MVFKSFRTRVIIRLGLIILTISGLAFLINTGDKLISVLILSAILLFEVIELFRFIEQTNRRLSNFLESVRYSDFVSGFSAGNKLGKSFHELNDAFNEVMDAFRKARSEKEEHWQYLNTVVQHVETGVISFDEEGNIGIINNNAKKYFSDPGIRNINDIKDELSRFRDILMQIGIGDSRMFQLRSNVQLALRATEIRLKGVRYKLVAIQNIHTELQQKEIESWQNLTRVLRHEIMNSITPIASLTATMKEILIEDLDEKDGYFELKEDGMEDLQEGLATIESRSRSLINFIDAYREYTNIPEPKFRDLNLHELLDHIANLEKIEIRRRKIDFKCEVEPEDLKVYADEELLELVLINLVKNAIEAVQHSDKPRVSLSGERIQNRIVISVEDNGNGIEPEALERIFIPFYTTKDGGSGIGLALSRQIMLMHNGSIQVESKPGKTRFRLSLAP